MRTYTAFLVATLLSIGIIEAAQAGSPLDAIDPTCRATCGIRPTGRTNPETNGYDGSTIINSPYCKFMYEEKLKTLLVNSCGADSQGTYRRSNCFYMVKKNQAYVLCTAMPDTSCTRS